MRFSFAASMRVHEQTKKKTSNKINSDSRALEPVWLFKFNKFRSNDLVGLLWEFTCWIAHSGSK